MGIIGAIADCLDCIISGALLSPLGGNAVSDGKPIVIIGLLTGIVDCICDCICCGCVVFGLCEAKLMNVAHNLDDRIAVRQKLLYERCLRDAFGCLPGG